MAEPTGPDDHRSGAREQLRLRGANRVIGRESGIRQRHGLDRIEVAERDEMAGVVDDQVFGHRAGGAQTWRGDAELGSAGAVVLSALRAGSALPAAPRSVDGVRAADLDALDAGA